MVPLNWKRVAVGSTGENATFTREATGLVRALSTIDVFLTSTLTMGLIYPFLYGFFATSTYQGVNLPVTVWLGLPVVLIVSYAYSLMSASFPRSGGDYVWSSRIIHPAIGFAFNFGIAIVLMSFIAFNAEWFLVYGLGPMLANFAVVTGNSSFLNSIPLLSQPTTIFVTTLIFVAVLGAVSLLQLKVSYRFMLVLFAIIVVAILTYIIALLYAGPATFQANFSRLSGTSYGSILSAASSAKFVTTFTVSGTVLGSVWTFFNYGGFNASVYVAGEVRRNSRAQLYGMLAAVVLFAILMFGIFEASYYAIGSQFVSAASLLASNGNPAYSLPSPPVDEFLVVFASPNSIVAFLVPLGVLAGTVAGAIIVFPIVSRMIFSWSFDRILPARISQVNGRGAPIYATAVVILVALFFAVLSQLTDLKTLLLYDVSLVWFQLAIGGIAALVLPFRRRDLFETASGAMRRKIGGVPLISILGGFTAIAGFALVYASITPSIILTPLNAPLLGIPFGILAAGLVLYFFSTAYRKRQGIDLSLAFKEIPPE